MRSITDVSRCCNANPGAFCYSDWPGGLIMTIFNAGHHRQWKCSECQEQEVTRESRRFYKHRLKHMKSSRGWRRIKYTLINIFHCGKITTHESSPNVHIYALVYDVICSIHCFGLHYWNRDTVWWHCVKRCNLQCTDTVEVFFLEL